LSLNASMRNVATSFAFSTSRGNLVLFLAMFLTAVVFDCRYLCFNKIVDIFVLTILQISVFWYDYIYIYVL
jgi:hypothetical protein